MNRLSIATLTTAGCVLGLAACTFDGYAEPESTSSTSAAATSQKPDPDKVKAVESPNVYEKVEKKDGVQKSGGLVSAVIAPFDGTDLDDCEKYMLVHGLANAPGAKIVINAYNPRDGEWEFIGWAESSATVSGYGGLYHWESPIYVPFWYWESEEPGNGCPDGLKARIRAREFDDSGYVLDAMTYTDDGMACFVSTMATASSVVDALEGCRTGDDLVLTAPRAFCGTFGPNATECGQGMPMPWCECAEEEPEDPSGPGGSGGSSGQDDPPEDDPEPPGDDEPECVEGEECEVHPAGCDIRGAGWKVKGRTVCVGGEPVCEALAGRDYCTRCAQRVGGEYCGECAGGSCSESNPCSPGASCYSDGVDSPRMYCHSLDADGCTSVDTCWKPEEVGPANEHLGCAEGY